MGHLPGRARSHPKHDDGAEIVSAVRGAVAGEVRIDPAVAGKVLSAFNRLAGQMSRQPPLANPPQPLLEELTERELSLLQEMAQGRSNREIAETLHLAECTGKNYVSIVVDKLHANHRTQAAVLALKRGLATLE